MTKSVTLLVCPEPSCGNYYGAPSCAGLNDKFTGVGVDDRDAHVKAHGTPYRHTRAECPDCRGAGRGRVVRETVTVEVPLPAERTAPVELAKALVG